MIATQIVQRMNAKCFGIAKRILAACHRSACAAPCSRSLARSRWLGPYLLVPLLAFLSGCGEELDSQYGLRSGAIGGKSVNGTAVLSEMFRQAGHRVHSWRWLSPKLDQADVIVWAPDDYEPPTPEVRQWLEEWLAGHSHSDNWREPAAERTLIYIGRDYDAAPAYWKAVQPLATPQQAAEYTRRLSEAIAWENTERADLPKSKIAGWFTLDGAPKRKPVNKLSGPWSEGIDPSKAKIELGALLIPREGAEILLSSEHGALVSRLDWNEYLQSNAAENPGDYESGPSDSSYYEESDYPFDDPYGYRPSLSSGKLILAANGSFLLNYPLVNHEHRRLAGRLVDEVGPPELNVVFLESGGGGPPIRDKDPEASMPSWLKFLEVWPLNIVILHLALLGVIFCLARWPIFGLARELPQRGLADFGKHIGALGGLLAKTGDRDYAAARLNQYEQLVQGENVAVEVVEETKNAATN